MAAVNRFVSQYSLLLTVLLLEHLSHIAAGPWKIFALPSPFWVSCPSSNIKILSSFTNSNIAASRHLPNSAWLLFVKLLHPCAFHVIELPQEFTPGQLTISVCQASIFDMFGLKKTTVKDSCNFHQISAVLLFPSSAQLKYNVKLDLFWNDTNHFSRPLYSSYKQL